MSLIKGVMSLTVDLVQQTTSSFLMDLPHRCNSKGPHSSISSILLPYPDIALDRYVCKLVGLLTLSQYFSLSRFALRDLDFDRELQSMSRLCSDISERRMAKEMSALLPKDPFVQSTGVFVKSFFITVLIQPSQVPLKFSNAASAVLSHPTELSGYWVLHWDHRVLHGDHRCHYKHFVTAREHYAIDLKLNIS